MSTTNLRPIALKHENTTATNTGKNKREGTTAKDDPNIAHRRTPTNIHTHTHNHHQNVIAHTSTLSMYRPYFSWTRRPSTLTSLEASLCCSESFCRLATCASRTECQDPPTISDVILVFLFCFVFFFPFFVVTHLFCAQSGLSLLNLLLHDRSCKYSCEDRRSNRE